MPMTHESRGNGGSRHGCGFASGRLLGGNWTPHGILQLDGEVNFSFLGQHVKRSQILLCTGLFSKN